jgi:hypothetical protein
MQFCKKKNAAEITNKPMLPLGKGIHEANSRTGGIPKKSSIHS